MLLIRSVITTYPPTPQPEQAVPDAGIGAAIWKMSL
jgi:hypothetical protein